VRGILGILLIVVGLGAKGENGWSPLHYALYDGNITHLKHLIAATPTLIDTPSKAGIAPLHMAVKLRNLEAVKLLIASGADIDTQDGNGQTPLHYAIAQNLESITRTLITHHADMDILNNYAITPLHQAAYTGNVTLVQLMLDRGVSVDLRNANGNTACQMAFAKRNFGVSSLLLGYTKLPCGSEELTLRPFEKKGGDGQ